MNELVLRANMSQAEFGFVWLAVVEPELADQDNVPDPLRDLIRDIEEGQGFNLELTHDASANHTISVFFHFRKVDVRHKVITGTIEVRNDKLEQHLDNLGIKPKRAFRSTFAPLLDFDFTLHTSLRLFRGKVVARVEPKPNLILIKGGG